MDYLDCLHASLAKLLAQKLLSMLNEKTKLHIKLRYRAAINGRAGLQ